MKSYDPHKLEEKWNKKWQEDKIYQPEVKSAKNPYYNLMMFPYPSAEGLHVGNVYAFVGADVHARFQRMQGKDVFEPIGLDGFGIHSENFALKIGRHPMNLSKVSQENFYRQLHGIGNSFDWSKTLETYDPKYYKWTQWLFIQLFKAGLAYRGKAEVNYCPSCKTVLADEQVIGGECERCGSKVEKKELEQWFVQGEDKDILKKIQIFQGSSVLNKITLAPKQKKDLNLHVGIPENEPASDYYFSILFVSTQSGGNQENSAVSSGGVSTNVLLSVGHKNATKGSISEFSAPAFLSHGPVPFIVKVNNQSDHFINIKGNLVIRNMFGDAVGNVDLLPVNVLEKSERIIPASGSANIINPQIMWNEKFLLGFYKARLTVSLSEEGPVLVKDTSFFAFPIEVPVGLILSLGIVGFAWKRAQNKEI